MIASSQDVCEFDVDAVITVSEFVRQRRKFSCLDSGKGEELQLATISKLLLALLDVNVTAYGLHGHKSFLELLASRKYTQRHVVVSLDIDRLTQTARVRYTANSSVASEIFGFTNNRETGRYQIKSIVVESVMAGVTGLYPVVLLPKAVWAGSIFSFFSLKDIGRLEQSIPNSCRAIRELVNTNIQHLRISYPVTIRDSSICKWIISKEIAPEHLILCTPTTDIIPFNDMGTSSKLFETVKILQIPNLRAFTRMYDLSCITTSTQKLHTFIVNRGSDDDADDNHAIYETVAEHNPHLRVLVVDFMTNHQLKDVSIMLKELQALTVYNSSEIEEDGIQTLLELQPTLHTLRLSGLELFSMTMVNILADYGSSIESLAIEGPFREVTREMGLETVRRCCSSHLHTFKFGPIPSDQVLLHLPYLSNIRNLSFLLKVESSESIRNKVITNHVIALAQHCPQLLQLNIQSNACLEDSILYVLSQQCTHLEKVHLGPLE